MDTKPAQAVERRSLESRDNSSAAVRSDLLRDGVLLRMEHCPPPLNQQCLKNLFPIHCSHSTLQTRSRNIEAPPWCHRHTHHGITIERQITDGSRSLLMQSAKETLENQRLSGGQWLCDRRPGLG